MLLLFFFLIKYYTQIISTLSTNHETLYTFNLFYFSIFESSRSTRIVMFFNVKFLLFIINIIFHF